MSTLACVGLRLCEVRCELGKASLAAYAFAWLMGKPYPVTQLSDCHFYTFLTLDSFSSNCHRTE
jgi:hypothetical protein